jgi:hypothetical protein
MKRKKKGGAKRKKEEFEQSDDEIAQALEGWLEVRLRCYTPMSSETAVVCHLHGANCADT